jgi:tRNA pseudouridine55 synthase
VGNAEAPLPEFNAVTGALPELTGRLRQCPPAYSAVHVAGRRAYDLARRGEAPELPERTVTVADVELVDWQPPDLTVMLTCSAGTYVRSWARDLGVAVASRAYVAHLRRLSIGPFTSRDAVSPDDFACGNLLPPAQFLRRVPGVQILRIQPRYRRAVVHGQALDARFFTSDPEPGAAHYAALDEDDCLLAMLRRHGEHPMPVGWSYAGVFADR